MESVSEINNSKVNGETTKDVPDNVSDVNSCTCAMTEIPVTPKSRNSVGSLNAVAEHSEEHGEQGGKDKGESAAPAKPVAEVSGASVSTTAPTKRIPHLHKLEK